MYGKLTSDGAIIGEIEYFHFLPLVPLLYNHLMPRGDKNTFGWMVWGSNPGLLSAKQM